MEKIAGALGRLERAIERLDLAVAAKEASAASAPKDQASLPGIALERDQLATEIEHLRERASKDARLRAEAASAVREALRDLRGAVGQEAGHA